MWDAQTLHSREASAARRAGDLDGGHDRGGGDRVLCQASIGAERTEGGAPRHVDRSRPCGFDRNLWSGRSDPGLGSASVRQRPCPRSSATCTVTACALVYAAGQ
jgi:hypothetical protein